MSETVIPTPTGYKDRSAGLIVFGAIHILLGVAALCVVFAVAAASEIAPSAAAPPRGTMATNVAFYGLMAAYFFAIGIGSIRKRRWARAIGLVGSALWLAAGLVALLFTAAMVPHMTPLFPPSQTTLILTLLFSVIALMYVIVPLPFLLFYRSPHVKATVEAADPRARWTDRVPEPVLGLVVMMAAASILLFASIPYATLPVAGFVLTGAPAVITLLVFAGLCGFLSMQLYQLKRSAWWTLMLLQVVSWLLVPFTLLRTDVNALYEKSGLMTPQVRAMHLDTMVREPAIWIATVVSWLAFLGYLLWVRRYFDLTPRTRVTDPA
jgi:hypothetical protein